MPCLDARTVAVAEAPGAVRPRRTAPHAHHRTHRRGPATLRSSTLRSSTLRFSPFRPPRFDPSPLLPTTRRLSTRRPHHRAGATPVTPTRQPHTPHGRAAHGAVAALPLLDSRPRRGSLPMTPHRSPRGTSVHASVHGITRRPCTRVTAPSPRTRRRPSASAATAPSYAKSLRPTWPEALFGSDSGCGARGRCCRRSDSPPRRSRDTTKPVWSRA